MTFLEKFKRTISNSISFEELKELVSEDIWNHDIRFAAYLALRRSGIFDEDNYLKTYEDVNLSCYDPIDHFIRFGVDEGRKFTKKNNSNNKYIEIKKTKTKYGKLEQLERENEILVEQLAIMESELKKYL